MSPMHMSPAVFVRVVLMEQVINAPMLDKAAGIVDPIFPGAVVIARSEVLHATKTPSDLIFEALERSINDMQL